MFAFSSDWWRKINTDIQTKILFSWILFFIHTVSNLSSVVVEGTKMKGVVLQQYYYSPYQLSQSNLEISQLIQKKIYAEVELQRQKTRSLYQWLKIFSCNFAPRLVCIDIVLAFSRNVLHIFEQIDRKSSVHFAKMLRYHKTI